jgi:exopolysaccharide production protein ExoQ
MKHSFRRTSQWLLGLSIYLGGWYFEGATFQFVQLGAVGLFLAAGFLTLMAGNSRRIGIGTPEYVLGGAFTFAMLVAFVQGNLLSTMYGAMFLLVLVSAALLTRQEDEASMGLIFRRIYLALLVTILVVQPADFFTSVVGTTVRSVGLVRFTPLGMHPNLSGLVYGGGALLFFQSFLASTSRRQKVFSLAIVVMCLAVVLAASARASLLALGVAGVVGALLLAWRGSSRLRMAMVVSAFFVLCVGLLMAENIANYLTVILDLDSNTRGVSSGATGRTDIWRNGIELVFSDPVLLFIGRGVRGAGPEVIGFPVESSYINLALENGMVFGLLIAFTFVVTTWRSLRQSIQAGVMNPALFMSGLMLLFVLTQSIFNRYLIAVGNPFSLLTLFLLLRLNLRATATSTDAAPASPSQDRTQLHARSG